MSQPSPFLSHGTIPTSTSNGYFQHLGSEGACRRWRFPRLLNPIVRPDMRVTVRRSGLGLGLVLLGWPLPPLSDPPGSRHHEDQFLRPFKHGMLKAVEGGHDLLILEMGNLERFAPMPAHLTLPPLSTSRNFQVSWGSQHNALQSFKFQASLFATPTNYASRSSPRLLCIFNSSPVVVLGT